MKVELTEKEIKFLIGVLGPMHEEQYKENINKSLSLMKKEKEVATKFTDERKYRELFNKLISINEEKSLHYK